MTKVRTKSAKLKAKRARKKDDTIIYREPNGRRSRAKDPASRVALEARARRMGLTLNQAMDQKAATFIGYLSIIGRKDGISSQQYEAAQEYLRVRSNYLRAIKAPDSLANTDGGTPSDDVSDDYADWCQRAVKRYDDVRKVVLEAQAYNRSENLLAALDLCIIRGEPHFNLVGATRILCNVLARHFGMLTDSCKSPRLTSILTLDELRQGSG